MKKLPAIILSASLLLPGSVVLSAPAHAVVTPASMSNVIAADNLKQVQEVFDEINKFRASKGLKPVKYNLYVEEVAQEWSNHMGAQNDFSHNPNFWQDPRVSGRTNSGEIIAGRFDRSGKGLVQQWINSAPHNAIMSNPEFNTIGIGITFTNKAGGRMETYGNVNFHKFPNGKDKTYNNPTEARKAQGNPIFKDVPSNHLFANEIRWMKNSGVSTGWADGTYRPYENVTREGMAAFMYRAAGSPAYTPPAKSPFKDVSTNNVFYKEISWMASEGISTGWADGTYRPLASVNRDTMAAFMYRAAGSPAYTPPKVSPFKDVPTNNVFYKEIAWMNETGIANGWADGTYRPYEPVTREAMAAFMYRFDAKL